MKLPTMYLKRASTYLELAYLFKIRFSTYLGHKNGFKNCTRFTFTEKISSFSSFIYRVLHFDDKIKEKGTGYCTVWKLHNFSVT